MRLLARRRPEPGELAMGAMCPIEGPAAGFANQLPGELGSEMAAASRVGAAPINAGSPQFAAAVNEGTIKWVVTQSGDLVITPAEVGGVEISHAVLSGGENVLAAGTADVAGAGGNYVGLGISPYSGHFLNGASAAESAASEAIGRQAFARYGIVFP